MSTNRTADALTLRMKSRVSSLSQCKGSQSIQACLNKTGEILLVVIWQHGPQTYISPTQYNYNIELPPQDHESYQRLKDETAFLVFIFWSMYHCGDGLTVSSFPPGVLSVNENARFPATIKHGISLPSSSIITSTSP